MKSILSRISRHASYANVIASLALFIALGGASYAAVKLPAESVGTKELRRAAVTTSKLRAGAITPAKVAPKTRALFMGETGAPGQQGPAGPSGERGPAGEKGAPGISLFANVTGGGTLESGTATGAARTSQGTYIVSFGRDVSACSAVVSAGPTDGGESRLNAHGITRVADDSLQSNQIEVNFHRPDPTTVVAPADTDFHLIVAC
jgi:hypothetical protein